MKVKHTPGPWETFETTTNHGVTPTAQHLGDICHVRGFDSQRSKQEEMANARLIAAAPEMLEALNAFVKWAEASASDDWNLVRQARAAIAATEGE